MTTLSVSVRADTGGGGMALRRVGVDGRVEAQVREVFDAHYGRLAGWTASLVGDHDLAHDLATEAFVRLLAHWDEVEDPRPWLYGVTANLVRDTWRKRSRERVAYARVGLAQQEGNGPDLADRTSVRDAVLMLPDRLRVTVLLHYFADLTVAQTAAQLGKSEGAVKRDLFDARRRLQPLLEGVR